VNWISTRYSPIWMLEPRKKLSAALHTIRLRLYYITVRGNSCKLVKSFSRHDVWKYSFTQRIVNTWNSLPEHVINSSSVNSYKNNLDKFWASQEVYYNFKCDITGTGNRSLCQLEWYVIVIKCDTRRRTKRLPSLRFSTPIRYDTIRYDN